MAHALFDAFWQRDAADLFAPLRSGAPYYGALGAVFTGRRFQLAADVINRPALPISLKKRE
jgi:hypothetical protein